MSRNGGIADHQQSVLPIFQAGATSRPGEQPPKIGLLDSLPSIDRAHSSIMCTSIHRSDTRP